MEDIQGKSEEGLRDTKNGVDGLVERKRAIEGAMKRVSEYFANRQSSRHTWLATTPACMTP